MRSGTVSGRSVIKGFGTGKDACAGERRYRCNTIAITRIASCIAKKVPMQFLQGTDSSFKPYM